MRIAVITQNEPFYLPPALDAFCSARRSDVVALVILSAFDERLFATARRLYGFYGPLDFCRLTGRFARAKLAGRLNRIHPFTRPYSARDVARRQGIPVYRPGKINAPDFARELKREIQPDLLVSIAASQILRQPLLDVPPMGCINLHSAPLPRYQGMMPNFWTMVHGEREAAVTVHYMVEALDAGDIIVQLPVPIRPGDALHDLMVRSKQVGVRALLQAVEQIERGTARPRPMDTGQATYFSFPTRKDARRLRETGHALL